MFAPPAHFLCLHLFVQYILFLRPVCLFSQDAITAGKGVLLRDTESGQLLIDLVRHGDVIEMLVWINSWGEQVYKAVWGDKDTYGIAFAVAGKAQHFSQVQVRGGEGGGGKETGGRGAAEGGGLW